MKSERKHKNIEELYRARLGEREIPVSDNFWPRLEGKLRFREFLRFRPGNFNIYYLAGLIAATALTVSVLVLNDRGGKPPANVPDILIKADSTRGSNESIIIEKETFEAPGRVEKEKTGEKISDRLTLTIPVEETEEAHGLTGSGDKRHETTITEKVDPLAVDNKLITGNVNRPVPIADFNPLISYGCAPFSIYFRNLSHNYDSCIWEFGDGGISTDRDPVWVYDEAGDYEVRLMLFGKGDSKASRKGMVTVYPRPVARFEISEGNPAIPDEQVHFYNFSQGATKWEWDFGDGKTSHDFEPSHFYDRAGSYSVSLRVSSEYGCIDSMVLTNAVGSSSCYIRFPNAFIPNSGGPTGGYYSTRSDQQEEVFHPVYSGVTSYNLKIYSRMGLLVFESNDLQIGWDGYYKGQMAEPGVYVWKARGTYKTGESFVKGGDVTLLPQW